MMQFCIGKYEDEVLCNVVPMQASHMFLKRPWQLNRKIHYDGYTEKYFFDHNNRKVVLAPPLENKFIKIKLLYKKRVRLRVRIKSKEYKRLKKVREKRQVKIQTLR